MAGRCVLEYLRSIDDEEHGHIILQQMVRLSDDIGEIHLALS